MIRYGLNTLMHTLPVARYDLLLAEGLLLDLAIPGDNEKITCHRLLAFYFPPFSTIRDIESSCQQKQISTPDDRKKRCPYRQMTR